MGASVTTAYVTPMRLDWSAVSVTGMALLIVALVFCCVFVAGSVLRVKIHAITAATSRTAIPIPAKIRFDRGP